MSSMSCMGIIYACMDLAFTNTRQQAGWAEMATAE